jgi:hypothetical protein
VGGRRSSTNYFPGRSAHEGRIDLPGKDRTIKNIKLAYANLPGGGKAKVASTGPTTWGAPCRRRPRP